MALSSPNGIAAAGRGERVSRFHPRNGAAELGTPTLGGTDFQEAAVPDFTVR